MAVQPISSVEHNTYYHVTSNLLQLAIRYKIFKGDIICYYQVPAAAVHIDNIFR